MFKNGLICLVISVWIFAGCTQSKGKTEINVQLSEAECLYSLSNYSQDSVFLSAYRYSRENYIPESDDFVALFSDRLLGADPEIRIAAFFTTIGLRDKIDFNSANREVIAVLKEEIRNTMEQTTMVLKTRIFSSCKKMQFPGRLFDRPVVEVSTLPGKNSYLFTVNRKSDKDRITKILETQGSFGIWETYSMKDLRDSQATSEDSLFFAMLYPSFLVGSEDKESNRIGTASLKDTARVNSHFKRPMVMAYFPRHFRTAWEENLADTERDSATLVAIKITTRDNSPILNGDYIKDVTAYNSKERTGLKIGFIGDGVRVLSRITRENQGRQLAIEIDNYVYYNYMVPMEINGGVLNIPGNFTPEDARDMAIILTSGTIMKNSVTVTGIN